jgi:hypothetical protein
MQRETEYSNYNRLLEQAREAGASTARTWIPKLCQALREEDKNLSNEDIRDRVEKDCAYIWSKSTIRTYIPGEFKDLQKQEAGRKGREKQLEEPIPAGGARETGAENSSVPSKVLESESFEEIRRPVGVYSKDEMIKREKEVFSRARKVLEEESKKKDDIIKQKNDIIKQKENEIDRLRQAQDISDIPHKIVEDKIGPVKVQNLSKISEFDRRGFKALVSRFAELVRRKMTSEGHATVKFYILTKDRTTNIEYLVPVNYTVDMFNRSTDVILDEDRL